MTILGIFLNDEVRTGGHRRYLELLEGLAERGNRVVVVLNRQFAYESEHLTVRRIEARYVRGGIVPIALVFRKAVRRDFAEIASLAGKPDCILIHGETHFLAALLLKRKLGTPLVFGHRSNAVRESMMKLSEDGTSMTARLGSTWELRKYRRYERMIARNADLAVFQSTYDRNDFLSRAPMASERAAVVPGNIGPPRFRAEHAGTNRSTALGRVIFVGTFGVRKGVRYLVDAILLLAERGVNGIRFELVGPGPDRARYKALFDERGLSGIVSLEGRIADPFQRIAAADLMVVPSLFDSYPDTTLEALHVGTPVIGSAVGGIPDQLVHEDLLFPPMDAMAIADRIERCVREPGFYTHLKALCAERRKAFLFDWAEAWETVMRELLGSRIPGS
ncbi:MAG: glycosyltransferase family 4 protein [Spirochaetes bacterium]|nr:glycosyltransferase family 4 protein [Spirochaetota bacterium]